MNNKETLKEVKPKDIQRIIASTNAQTASIEILQLFTQLQAKRRYSEKDMIEFALFLEIHLPMKPRKTHHQLLEQFKKQNNEQ